MALGNLTTHIYAFAVAVALAEAQYALPYAITVLTTSVPHAPLE